MTSAFSFVVLVPVVGVSVGFPVVVVIVIVPVVVGPFVALEVVEGVTVLFVSGVLLFVLRC